MLSASEGTRRTCKFKVTGTREMWNTNDLDLWHKALNRYWTFVKPSNLALEKEIDQLDAEAVRAMNPRAWFEFLLEKYFRWNTQHRIAMLHYQDAQNLCSEQRASCPPRD